MIPNTTDTSQIFLTVQPDLAASMRYWQEWSTLISRSRSQTEQRSNLRSRARYAVAFIANHNGPEWAVRRGRMLAEFGAPVVVPIWPRFFGYVSAAGDVVTVARDIERAPFKPGGYAFFEEDGLASVFREVTAVSGATMTLASGNAAHPDIAFPAYTAAAWVYPCIRGIRRDVQAEWRHEQLDSTSETVHIEEL